MKVKKSILLSVLSFAFLCLFAFVVLSPISILTASKKGSFKFSVVIDAGHGGIDGGCVGSNSNIHESKLNLLIAKELETLYKSAGFTVNMTREDDGGLYGSEEPGFKLRDLKKRVEITNEISPDIFISIHLNKYTSSSRRGAQVFYKINDKNSKNLAENIQASLNLLPESLRMYDPLKGDYYVLNEISATGVIVECGFLSNPVEESLLLTEEYRKKIARAIYDGSLRYLVNK